MCCGERGGALEEWQAVRQDESLVTDRFGADNSWGALPADPWAVLRPFEALNSVMYSDRCLGAMGEPDRDLELEPDLDPLLQQRLLSANGWSL